MRMKYRFMLLLLPLALLLAACAGAQTEPAPSPTLEPPPTAAPTEAPAAEAPQEEAPAAGGEARTFAIDPAASQASYTVDEEFFSGAVERLGKTLGFFTAIGVTDQVEGELSLIFDPSPLLSRGEFRVDISALTSDDQRRDNRIREQHLESLRFPITTFKPTAIENFPGDYTEGQPVTFDVSGEMTIRNVTQPMTFAVTATLDGSTLSGTATGTLLMTDYGFDPPEIPNFMTAENEVLVTIDFTAVEVES
jgi:polyisoprenoid-binding protein YceI